MGGEYVRTGVEIWRGRDRCEDLVWAEPVRRFGVDGTGGGSTDRCENLEWTESV